MPAPLIISLPLVAFEEGACGIKIYTADENKMPVDGIHQTLRVYDNQDFSLHCQSIRAVPATEVVYETESYNRMTPQIFKTYSTFQGEALN